MRVGVIILVSCFVFFMNQASGDAAAAGEAPNLRIGNYWEYSFETMVETLALSGTVRMEIAELDQTLVEGVIQDVFILRSTGVGEIAGSVDDEEVTGEISIGGRDVRLCSNFDLVASMTWISQNVTVSGLTVHSESGYDVRYFPTLDDYIGDDDPDEDTLITTETHVIGDVWAEFLGDRHQYEVDYDFRLTLEVTGTDVLVITPADPFKCFQVRTVGTSGDDVSVTTNYYSRAVGNYVKMKADSAYYFGMLGDLELVSYSYNPDGIPPNADAGLDFKTNVGELVTLNGTASSDNVRVVNYTWKFAEGGVERTLYGPEPQHTFETKGEYVVILTVYDKAGNSDNDSVKVRVIDLGLMNYFIGDEMWIGWSMVGAAVGVAVALAASSRRKRKRAARTARTPAPPARPPPKKKEPWSPPLLYPPKEP